MSTYQKNTWYTGDTITAEKLNNMENGIQAASQGGGGGGGLPEYGYEDIDKALVVAYSSGSTYLDWEEVIMTPSFVEQAASGSLLTKGSEGGLVWSSPKDLSIFPASSINGEGYTYLDPWDGTPGDVPALTIRGTESTLTWKSPGEMTEVGFTQIGLSNSPSDGDSLVVTWNAIAGHAEIHWVSNN